MDAARQGALRQVMGHLPHAEGFSVLTGPAGVGKTTLLRVVADAIGRTPGAYLLNAGAFVPCGAETDLLAITRACSYVDCMARSGARSADPTASLQSPFGAGGRRTAVVLLDDADWLSRDLLHQLGRWRRAFESVRGRMAVVVSAATPRTRAGEPLIENGRDRCIALEPFSEEDSVAFLRHGIQAAGYHGPELLTTVALHRIAALAAGNPAAMGRLCREAVSLAEAGAFPLPPERIEDAARYQAVTARSPLSPGADRRRAAASRSATTATAAESAAAPQGDLARQGASTMEGPGAADPSSHPDDAPFDTTPAALPPWHRQYSRPWPFSPRLDIPEPVSGTADARAPLGPDRSWRPPSLLRAASGAASVIMALAVAAAYLVEVGYIEVPRYAALRDRLTGGLVEAVSSLRAGRDAAAPTSEPAPGRDGEAPAAAGTPADSDDAEARPSPPTGLQLQADAAAATGAPAMAAVAMAATPALAHPHAESHADSQASSQSNSQARSQANAQADPEPVRPVVEDRLAFDTVAEDGRQPDAAGPPPAGATLSLIHI